MCIVGLALRQLRLYQQVEQGDIRHVLDLGVRFSWVVISAELCRSRDKLQHAQRLLPFNALIERPYSDLQFTCHCCELQLGFGWYEDASSSHVRICFTCGEAKSLACGIVGYDCVEALEILLMEVEKIMNDRQGM